MRLPTPLLASAFAQHCGAELHGPDQHFHGANEIHNVEVGDLTFVDHRKYYRSTLTSAASVVLIDKLPEEALRVAAADKTLLVHPEPFAAYDALIREVRPAYVLNERVARSANVHASAIVEPGAIIGPKVIVGAYTRICANAVVYGPARIGERCVVGAGTVIGDQAFYFRGVGDKGRPRWTTGGDVVIEDYVEIGPQCVVARGVSASTRIGRGTKIDALCQIAHDVVIGADCLLAAQVGIAGNATLEDRVTLYGQVGVAQNVTVGEGSVVSGMSGVSKDLPAGGNYYGVPAQPIRDWMKMMAKMRRL